MKDWQSAEYKEKPNFNFFFSYGHFCDVITPIFDDNSKNRNRRIFLLFFPFYSAHSAPFIKFWPLLRAGRLHVRNQDTAHFLRLHSSAMNDLYHLLIIAWIFFTIHVLILAGKFGTNDDCDFMGQQFLVSKVLVAQSMLVITLFDNL